MENGFINRPKNVGAGEDLSLVAHLRPLPSPYCSTTGAVFRVFRERIDYGTEFKQFATLEANKDKSRRFDPVVGVSVKREARIGDPDFKRITTNHAERNNLNIRIFNRRFTRKTIGY